MQSINAIHPLTWRRPRAEIAGVEVAELNRLELEVLLALDFRLCVGPEEFDRRLDGLLDFAAARTVGCGLRPMPESD